MLDASSDGAAPAAPVADSSVADAPATDPSVGESVAEPESKDSKPKKRGRRRRKADTPEPREDSSRGEDSQEQDPQEQDTGQGSAAQQPTPEPEEPEGDPAEPGNEPSDEELLRAVSALIFASPEPLSTARLSELAGARPKARIEAALETLAGRLGASGLGLELRSIAGGWQILTTPEQGAVVARLFQARRVERVSPASLETLAVIAYRQPVTKAEIEAIRGVQAGPILRNLVDRGLVRVTGRADQPGHPLQYGTTRAFLERFGLADLGDLPRDGELARE